MNLFYYFNNRLQYKCHQWNSNNQIDFIYHQNILIHQILLATLVGLKRNIIIKYLSNNLQKMISIIPPQQKNLIQIMLYSQIILKSLILKGNSKIIINKNKLDQRKKFSETRRKK